MKTAVGYVRVSSEEQADSGLGLEAQRDRIRAFCTLKGLQLNEVFEDAGVSGGKALETRPAGSKLVVAARKTKAVVIVAKFDRLFRSVADAANTIADFDRKGIELVAISEGFDMTNPYGRAMAQMASVFAELERAMIRERTRVAMTVKRNRGERISRHAPFGWEFGPDGRLVENPTEQETICLMRRLQAEGKGFDEIARVLDQAGIKPKRAEKWARATVRQILRRAA
jgi:DNA invertase Pin-like site-specific DNA recombinase